MPVYDDIDQNGALGIPVPMDQGSVSEFEAFRGLLFSVAYRMTGSAADAEDLVQDAYIRYASADRDVVRDVKAFLVTIVTRLALDRLKSAQVQREEYVGAWFPEPVATSGSDDPLAIEFALLTAMERLSPQERAVLLMADVLEYDHGEIADMLGISAASSRQLLHRARERVARPKRRFEPSLDEQQRLITSFMTAVRDGNVDVLRNVLAEDVVAQADGGGKVAGAGIHAIHGVDHVSRLYFGLMKKFGSGMSLSFEEINGATGVLLWAGDELQAVINFDIDADHIRHIATVVNPAKLRFVKKQLSGRRSPAFHQAAP